MGEAPRTDRASSAMTVPADWHDFATMSGGASAALTGLLFVSVSLNAKRIAGHTGLRASAAQTLVLFLTPLIIATALLAPRQPGWVLGTELMAIGLVASFVLLANRSAKLGLAEEDLRLISIFNRSTPSLIAMVLVIASGLILAVGQEAGLYLLFPASILLFTSGVLNAWFFLLPLPEGQRSTTSSALSRRHHDPSAKDQARLAPEAEQSRYLHQW